MDRCAPLKETWKQMDRAFLGVYPGGAEEHLSFLSHTSLLSACHAILPSPIKRSVSFSGALRHRQNISHLQFKLPESCHNKYKTIDTKSRISNLHVRVQDGRCKVTYQYLPCVYEYMTVDVKSSICISHGSRCEVEYLYLTWQ
jgi:hypothetical protein